MLNENVPDDTTPPPLRARLPRGFGTIDPMEVLDAAMIVQPVTRPTWEAAQAAAEEINEARQHHGRHGEETALAEIGALVTVRLAASGTFRPPQPGDPVLHATDPRLPPMCGACGHRWNEHTVDLDGCAADDEAAMGGCDCPGYEGWGGTIPPPPHDDGSRCPSCDHPTDMHGSAGCRGDHPVDVTCGCMEWWKHH